MKPHPNLILHCGGHPVSLDDIRITSTPNPTDSWHPIPHHQLIQQVENTLTATNLRIGSVAHALSHSGQRYFGLMEILGKKSSDEYCYVLGLRNSHDKKFPAGLVAGAQIFCCDNLSFSGEIKLERRHTRFIMRDLPQLVERSIGQLMEKWNHQDRRIEAYKNSALENHQAHDLVIRAVDVGVCGNRLIPTVLHQWREPDHKEFNERNVWSFFNAFTESLKDCSIFDLPKRTQCLHGLLDSWVGLS